MMLLLTLLVGVAAAVGAETAQPAPILFIIQAQKGEYHQSLAEKTRENIRTQWSAGVPSHQMGMPQIILTTELPADVVDGAWTYFPLFDFLAGKLEEGDGIGWVGILAENTEVDIRALGEFAGKYNDMDPSQVDLYGGRALADAEPTIIHHFHTDTEDKKLMFPDPDSGIFLSRSLVLKLKGKSKSTSSIDFNIDPTFELSKFLVEELKVELTNIEEACSRKKTKGNCATYPRQEYKCLRKKETEKLEEMLSNLFVVVNTHSSFHEDRLPAIKSTWADILPNLHIISDVADESIPTEVLPYTVNTASGHCNKTRTFLNRFLEEDQDWLVIVDDDTVFSPVRMAQLIACYPTDEPVILGQRYGYKAQEGGYNYVTGGGGKIINRVAVKALTEGLEDGCSCPSVDTPEDMHIFGICAKRANIPINHSGRMFQARPLDYPIAMISYRKPVSFHKHWNIDPVKVYDEWFRKADDLLRKERNEKKSAKEEL